MNHLIIIPDRNSPGRKDYTGAFLPEARALKRLHERDYGAGSCSIVEFDASASMPARRAFVLSTLDRLTDGLSHLTLLCHGWSTGVQAGFTSATVGTLASTLEGCVPNDVRVSLFCCSTGVEPQDDSQAAPGTARTQAGNPGDNSFADLLRDALCYVGAHDCTVLAHTTAGHCTQNPNVIVFEGTGSDAPGFGGVMPVTRAQPEMWRNWVAALKTTSRFDLPYMSVEGMREMAGWKP